MLRRNASLKIDELKIDQDFFPDDEWIPCYVELIVCECKKRGITVESVRKCNSEKKGLHFYIKIKPAIDSTLANFLQWLFGDDARRVDFNRARIESGLLEWNKLFEVAGQRLRTIYKDNGAENVGKSG